MSSKIGEPSELTALPASRQSPTVRSLPGVNPDVQAEWVDVTVMPREVPQAPRGRTSPPPPARSRAEVYQAGLAESARFRESFMRWLEAHHLVGAVRSMSEPGGSLPMVHVRCAPRVLEQLRRAPEFEAGAMMPVELI